MGGFEQATIPNPMNPILRSLEEEKDTYNQFSLSVGLQFLRTPMDSESVDIEPYPMGSMELGGGSLPANKRL